MKSKALKCEVICVISHVIVLERKCGLGGELLLHGPDRFSCLSFLPSSNMSCQVFLSLLKTSGTLSMGKSMEPCVIQNKNKTKLLFKKLNA